MSFEYVSVEEAMARTGLRMIVVGDIPSGWSEAAKGIFHLKGIDWVAVRLAYDSEPLRKWAGGRSGPVVFYEKDRPRNGWAEVLLLAERLAPTPRLLPLDPAERALAFGFAHELCGEAGLGWSRRLQLIHWGLQGGSGFPAPVAHYLAKKYGYRAERAEDADKRVIELLTMLAARLSAQREAGSRYFVGDSVTAVDIYCAAHMAVFKPLAAEVCAMNETMRVAFSSLDAETAAALDPILLEHRDMMYDAHLELPLSL